MWVIKLGGSLAGGTALPAWLEAVAACGSGRLVVVPGGGVYADCVREQQARWDFDDGTAHAMALLAMDQYGLQLADMAHRQGHAAIRPATSLDAIAHALRTHAVPLWLPSRHLDGEATLARNWQVTSDSLALWLAQALRAQGVALVKSVAIDAGQMRATDAAAREWIDAAFPALLAQSPCMARLLGPTHSAALADLFGNPEACGLRLV